MTILTIDDITLCVSSARLCAIMLEVKARKLHVQLHQEEQYVIAR